MLNSVLTVESKKELLDKSKNTNSMVHLHLKLAS
jgi:hypothetical protein